MTGKSAFTPEVAKARHAEQVYRARMLDRMIANHFKFRAPDEYEKARRKYGARISDQRGPLPGLRDE